jgi:hypothetical protein
VLLCPREEELGLFGATALSRAASLANPRRDAGRSGPGPAAVARVAVAGLLGAVHHNVKVKVLPDSIHRVWLPMPYNFSRMDDQGHIGFSVLQSIWVVNTFLGVQSRFIGFSPIIVVRIGLSGAS